VLLGQASASMTDQFDEVSEERALTDSMRPLKYYRQMSADEAAEKASEGLEAKASMGNSSNARAPWKGERVAFIATVVAFIATVVVAAFAAIYVSNEDAKAQAAVAQSDFLHNQRQVAYAAFWTDFSSMYVALKECMVWFESGNREFVPEAVDVWSTSSPRRLRISRPREKCRVIPASCVWSARIRWCKTCWL
jgi:hypothetical protein